MKRLKLSLERDSAVLGESRQLSASASKMSSFGLTLENLMESKTIMHNGKSIGDEDSFLIVQVSALSKLFVSLSCPHCFQSGLTFELSPIKSHGFASTGKVRCTSCDVVVKQHLLCERSDRSESTKSPFEVNMRAIVAFRGIGCGYSAIKEWCEIMNMPFYFSQNTYNKINGKLNIASKETFNEIRQQSVVAVRDAYREIGVVPDDNGILDVAVSFDGAWHRRGHSSHNGLASVIDMVTGLPLDHVVLCNFCHKCAAAASQPNDPSWERKHLEDCPKNFNGSSNAMEVESALQLWGRSVEVNKMRYTTMLCDGDSKSYDSVKAHSVYGDVSITKEDCINHVSKRMGTALRNLVAIAKAKKESISGRGKLTQDKITKIQNFYGRAIKDNPDDIEMMRKRIFAILFHYSSSDNNPKHVHCPPGDRSWCFWQRAVAQGKEPGTHKDHETLGVEIGKRMVPIFQRLTDKELLKRCSRKKTQNANESLHSLIWKLCPKAVFVGRKTMETAVALACSQFSIGASFRQILCKAMGILEGDYLVQAGIQKDIQRIKLAEKKSREEWKDRRKRLKFNKSTQSAKKSCKEGQTYAAGLF